MAGLLATFVARTASAEPLLVEDTPSFSVDLGPLKPCIIIPASLRRAEWCVGMAPERAKEPPATDGGRLVAAAYVGLGGKRFGLLTIQKSLREEAGASDDEAIVRGMAGGSMPGAQLRASGVRSVPIAHGGRAARGSIDIEGGTGMWAALDHQSVVVGGAYTIIFLGSHDAQAEMDGMLDTITPSLSVRGQWQLNRTAAYLLASLALVGAIYWRLRVRSKSRASSRDS